MRGAVLLFLLAQLIVSPIAQASEVRAYYSQNSIWSPGVVMVDGKAYSPHFFSGFDLTEAMKSNSEAVEYADRAVTYRIVGNSLVLAGLAGAVGYTIAQSGNDRHWDAGTYWGIFLLGFIPGVFFEGASQVNLNKAVNAYNGISSRYTKLKPEKMMIVPTNDGAVAALGWSF